MDQSIPTALKTLKMALVEDTDFPSIPLFLAAAPTWRPRRIAGWLRETGFRDTMAAV